MITVSTLAVVLTCVQGTVVFIVVESSSSSGGGGSGGGGRVGSVLGARRDRRSEDAGRMTEVSKVETSNLE